MRSAAGQDLTVRPYGKWDIGGALRVEGQAPQLVKMEALQYYILDTLARCLDDHVAL
jgi:hypothetical protein